MTIVVPSYLRGPVDAPARALGVPARVPTSSRDTRPARARPLAGVCLAGVFVFPQHGAPRWKRPAPRCPRARAGRSAAQPAGVAGPFAQDPKQTVNAAARVPRMGASAAVRPVPNLVIFGSGSHP
jgi:hypothetical protein